MKENAETLYAAREKRVMDVIELRKPDRVPVTASFSLPVIAVIPLRI